MISWGIIGYGKMGSIFKEAVKETNSAKLLMIGSKTKQGNGVYNYESILDNDQIDAIYISTLNNTHNELIKQILKRGKKILCEKPLTTSLNKLDQIKNDLNNSLLPVEICLVFACAIKLSIKLTVTLFFSYPIIHSFF